MKRPTTTRATTRRSEVLSFLGLARRAGATLLGTEAVRGGLREGRVHLVLLAGDAAPGQRDKLTGLLRARDVPARTIGDRASLGASVGAGPLTAVGVTQTGFARRLLIELDADATDPDGPPHAPEDDQTYAG